jgi:energy-converting hydrogenase Eha subunit A
LIIPNISWSKNEGFSFEISIIVGIPDIACTQAGIDITLKGKTLIFI